MSSYPSYKATHTVCVTWPIKDFQGTGLRTDCKGQAPTLPNAKILHRDLSEVTRLKTPTSSFIYPHVCVHTFVHIHLLAPGSLSAEPDTTWATTRGTEIIN